MPIDVRPLEPDDVPACERILRGLPEWFGIEASNLQYIADLSTMPTLVATVDGEIAGFLTLKRHNEATSEIHCMAVERSRHRGGVGRALVEAAEHRVAVEGARLFQVKTLGPSDPDPGYTRTRAFYSAMGVSAAGRDDGALGSGEPRVDHGEAFGRVLIPPQSLYLRLLDTAISGC